MNDKLRHIEGGIRRLRVSISNDQYNWLVRNRESPSRILQLAIDELMRRERGEKK